jgi:dolichol kinase
MMVLAKSSIGFNSNYPVRKKAKYLVDGDDLKEILDYIYIEDDPTFGELSLSIQHGRSSSWGQELRRKAVHACSMFIPFLSGVNFHMTLMLLFTITVLYTISEWVRLNGIRFPVFGLITRLCVRSNEMRQFTFAPLTLAVGVILSLVFFSEIIACVVIVILAFADSFATSVGKFYGRVKIPYNRKKSVEGSVAFFVTALICAVFFLPLKTALIASFVSCLIETIPFKFDNISIPLGTGLFLGLII